MSIVIMAKAVKLPLSVAERATMKSHGLRVADLPRFEAKELARITGWRPARASELIALAEFQTLGSVGPRVAGDLVALGFFRIAELRGANPLALYRRLEALTQSRQDPCVEDALRCAVAQANFPDLADPHRQWWYWTAHRGETTVTHPAKPTKPTKPSKLAKPQS